MLVRKLHPGVEHYPPLKFDFALFFHAPQNCHSQESSLQIFKDSLSAHVFSFSLAVCSPPSTFPLLNN